MLWTSKLCRIPPTSGCLSWSLHLKHANWLISYRQLLSRTKRVEDPELWPGVVGSWYSNHFSSKVFVEHKIRTVNLPFGSRMPWPVDHMGSSWQKKSICNFISKAWPKDIGFASNPFGESNLGSPYNKKASATSYQGHGWKISDLGQSLIGLL